MIESIRLRNFRCFNDHKVELKPLSVIVGANNAGKSTLVEALRLISLVASRYRGLTYYSPPNWSELPKRFSGVKPSTKDLNFRGGSVFHKYGDPPSIITAQFDNGCKIELYIQGNNEVFGVITDEDGNPVNSKQRANKVLIGDVAILPQIGPLVEEENLLNEDYVERSLDSSLASRHFRNQLQLLKEQHFAEFCKRAEASWRGLHIESLDISGERPDQTISLLVRDSGFASEIGWMGHGVQMWLQTIWFLARTVNSETVILDEPDVYMHADLQRRLIRMLRGRGRQTLIATHSVEIMSEVNPDEILIINKAKPTSSFAPTLPVVQRAIEQLGGVHNIHLARLWGSQKCIHVEGKDMAFLKAFQDHLFPDSEFPFLGLPRLAVGGWSGWTVAIGSAMSLRNAAGEEIVSYCIFDSDYHTNEEINERYKQADEKGIQLHIWHRKEIENYLLIPAAILRVIGETANQNVLLPTASSIQTQLLQIAESLKEEVLDSLANEFQLKDRASGIKGANRCARKKQGEAWKTPDGILGIVSGKTVLSQLSKWSKENFGVSFSPLKIASELHASELSIEVKSVIKAIENGTKLPQTLRNRPNA